MVKRIRTHEPAVAGAGVILSTLLLASGCATNHTPISELAVRDAIEHYVAAGAEHLRAPNRTAWGTGLRPVKRQARGLSHMVLIGVLSLDGDGHRSVSRQAAAPQWNRFTPDRDRPTGTQEPRPTLPYFTLGVVPRQTRPPESQPAASGPTASAGVPAGYWRKNLWHQMGHEAKALGGRDFWRGFKTSFWDLENALLLTATMGASVAIRETGVDSTVRSRIHGHRQLGDMDEAIQILGSPGTHFAGAGVLWLTSTLTKDAKQHEVAKALTQALVVNGVTTLALKAAANTRAPNNEPYAWPSGHTSSAFTVAAVLNEYYGPLAGIPCFALASLVGYQRLDSRVHDFSDVVFGAMLGYVVGTSIARDEQAQFPELFGMKVVPFTDVETGASGLALMKSW